MLKMMTQKDSENDDGENVKKKTKNVEYKDVLRYKK